jgi:hypothetical protein
MLSCFQGFFGIRKIPISQNLEELQLQTATQDKAVSPNTQKVLTNILSSLDANFRIQLLNQALFPQKKKQ